METEQQKSSHSGSQQTERTTSAIDVRELREIVMKQHKRNLDIYQRMKEDDVYIQFALCMPQQIVARTLKANCLEGERKELMTLMDKLMLESDKLEKLDRKNKFTEQRRSSIEETRTSVDASYGFMRKAWTQETSYDQNSDDKIDRLSKVVGNIKGNLQRVLAGNRRKDRIAQPLEDILLEIQSFTQLKEAYQRLRMNRQEMSYTFQSKTRQFAEKLKAKDKENDLLRVEIKEQKDRIRKLENQSIQTEVKTQQLTQRLNKLTFQSQKSQKRMKLFYTGTDYELIVNSSSLADAGKTKLVCERKLSEIRQFLENTQYYLSSEQQYQTNPSSNEEYCGSPTIVKQVPEKKSNSIKKMQSPCYRQQISNVKFARTNSLIQNGITIRKPSDESGIQAKFYTKLNIIEKLQEAFTK